jgi:universal stress protein A
MDDRSQPRIARILCPTDFSDFSRNALEHSLAIASAYGAAVTALHVMPQTLMHPELFPYLKDPIFVPVEIRERARERLDQLESEVEAHGVSFEAVLESGEAAHRILAQAESLPADLVVVGTRGRGGLERVVLGSVTERLLWNARTPTLVVEEPPRRRPSEGFPYGRILAVTTDATEGADTEKALEWARSFCRKAGGSLLVLEVRPGAVGRRRNPPEECTVEFVVLDPVRPEEAILRIASERDADLIVFENYDQTARELVRSAVQPVLVMRK